jgi:hypothetical protein
MANETLSYPYIPVLWKDQSGHYRLTLTTSNAAILSAVVGILLTFGIARLFSMTYTLTYMYLLHQKTKTVIDDQVNTIAANNTNPTPVLLSLLNLVYSARRRALASRIYYSVFLLGLVFGILQIVSVIMLRYLFVAGPVPITAGKCGLPSAPEPSNGDAARFESHRLALVERLSTQFSECIDNGDHITCPGTAGQSFSWEIIESEPSYCWFGSQYCFNGSRTITQRATITPSDLGTIRNSPLSFSATAECSHINSSEFIYHGFDATRNSAYYAYQFGAAGDIDIDNDTAIVYDLEQLIPVYSYPPRYVQYLEESNQNIWLPSAFLKNNLELPFLTDNVTAPSTLTLYFNSLFGTNSLVLNEDPLFHYVTIDSDGRYSSDLPVAVLACRERFRLQIEPLPGLSPLPNGRWVADGLSLDVLNVTLSEPNVEADLALFTTGFTLSIFNMVLSGLGGNVVDAQKTLYFGLQVGLPEAVSTRREFTRWFGVAMLYALNVANMLTSGTDNDWGYGITSLEGLAWFCDKTLRISAEHQSVSFLGLLLLIFGVAIISILSYTIEPLLWFIVKHAQRRTWAQAIKEALVPLALRRVLQLHRIAIETTSNQKFTGTLNAIPIVQGTWPRDAGIAPTYGVLKGPNGVGGIEVELNEGVHQLVSDSDMDNSPLGGEESRPHATILSSNGIHERAMNPDFNVNVIR